MLTQDVASVCSDQSLEDQVARLIEDAELVRPGNRFFALAQATQEVAPAAALEIALAWHEMTRAFMLTTIAGLGTLAAEIASGDDPSRGVLGAIQTAYMVIGDDMANLAPEFSAVSPKGADGIHYVWWADTIVAPLMDHLGASSVVTTQGLPEGIRSLIDNMKRLGSHRVGAAVQLRVVEAIALDIAVAFRRIYSKTTIDGSRPFRDDGALDWIDSHIKAETSHAASVSDDETGMTLMVATDNDRAEFMQLAQEYTASWAVALTDFARVLAVDATAP